MQKVTQSINQTNQRHSERRAMFPGSFNPFTIGHLSLVERGLDIFDTIVIAVGISSSKQVTEADIIERINPIQQLFHDNKRIEVIHYTGLTVDAARDNNCQFLLRGVRNSIDMEYEKTLADINRRIAGIETVILLTLPEHSSISSSMVRELKHYGHDVDEFLPHTTHDIPKD